MQEHAQEDGDVTLTQQPGEDSNAEINPQEKQVERVERGDQTEPVIAVAPPPKVAVVEPVQTRQAAKKLETTGGKRKAKAVEDELVKKPCLVIEP